jgi:formylglycine-generating enzyme required for sulfatase activity
MRWLLAPTLLGGLCAAMAVLPEPTRSAPAPIPKNRFTNSIGMKFVRIPAGKFTMGSPLGERGRSTQEQQHEVEISRTFFMSVYLVTQADYQKVMGTNPSYFSSTGAGAGGLKGVDTRDLPVETVTWDDAVAFCKKLSALRGEGRRRYRLPTEAEWEYACRGGAKKYSAYSFGDKITAADANHSGSSVGRVSKVGSYKPNAWGLYDMHGNVWHMCADYYDSGYYRVSPRKDPRGPKTGTTWVARGGSWSNGVLDCRSANRAYVTRGQRNSLVGFRIACDPGARADE